MILFLVAIGVVVTAVVATTLYAGIRSAPFVATPVPVIRLAFKLLELKSGETVLDPGCGKGTALVIAAKEFGARGIGYELSLSLFLYSFLAVRLNGVGESVRVEWGDLYKKPFREADVVFLWLTKRAYPGLKEKFEHELKPGTRIVVISSPLGFWEPYRIEPVSGRQPLYFYRVP